MSSIHEMVLQNVVSVILANPVTNAILDIESLQGIVTNSSSALMNAASE